MNYHIRNRNQPYNYYDTIHARHKVGYCVKIFKIEALEIIEVCCIIKSACIMCWNEFS